MKNEIGMIGLGSMGTAMAKHLKKKYKICVKFMNALVAQLDRAPDFGSGGSGFDS